MRDFRCPKCGGSFSMFTDEKGYCENCGRIDKTKYDYGDEE